MSFEFLPWLRLGLANLIQELDDGGDGAHSRASLELALSVRVGEDVETLSRDLHLLGAGDVLGVHPDAIGRTWPKANASGHKPHDLVFIEFTENDFPWRYTPAAPSGDRLRPWLALFVLEASEFALQEGAPLPALHVTSALALAQDLREAAAWAHVQVNAALPTDPAEAEARLAELHAASPERFTARLLSPRLLRPHQRYTAFLVPAFEAGRLAGLGEDNAGVPALQPAWSPGDSERRLPVYHRWSFETGEDADFEDLARRLRPQAVSAVAHPKIDLGEAAAQLRVPLGGPLSVARRAALKPPGDHAADFGHGPMRQALARETANDTTLRLAELPPGEDPLVDLAPLYGSYHAEQEAADATASQAPWLEQLNLDPGWRAIAGLGAALVHAHQERFMQEAWAQYDDVHEANLTLARMQLGAEAGAAMVQKHLADRSEVEQLQVVSALHERVQLSGAPLPEAVAPTPLPQAGFDVGLSKLTRRGGRATRPLRKQLDAWVATRQAHSNPAQHLSAAELSWMGAQLERDGLLTSLADNQGAAQRLVQAAAPLNPGDTASFDTSKLETAANGQNDALRLARAVAAGNQQDQQRALLEGRADFQAASPAALAAQAAVQPAPRIGQAAQARFTTLSVRDPDTGGPKPVMAAPHIDEPVYRLLLDQDLSLVVPGIAEMQPDTASLLAVEQSFVEALLAGMNHAMGEELLWREYPTDRRGSVFKQFWEGGADIEDMAGWARGSRLGDHAPPARRGLTALVIKGALVRAFEDLSVYAQRAAWHPQSRAIDDPRPRVLASPTPANLRAPLFRADCGGDVLILGFDLSASELRGGIHDPGWFLNLRERSQRVRFGLDPQAQDDAPRLSSGALSWVNLAAEDLSWEHLGVAPLGYAGLGGADSVVSDGQGSWTWGPSASGADLAALLLRMPALVGIHATDLLP